MDDKHKYNAGHDIHFIQAKFIGQHPWGWRPGIVRASQDGTHTIDYVEEPGSVTVWTSKLDRLELGRQVRVHETYGALALDGTWYSIKLVSGGLGSVPDPEDTSAWEDQMSWGVADLARGVGIDAAWKKDHPAT